jgi:hypothetical protein
LENLARDKHTNLLQKSVNYGHKKYYSTGPWCNIFYFYRKAWNMSEISEEKKCFPLPRTNPLFTATASRAMTVNLFAAVNYTLVK